MVNIRTLERPHSLSVVEHQQACAELQLRIVKGFLDHQLTVSGRLPKHPVRGTFCELIRAVYWVIEQDDAGVHCKGAGNQNFLPVPTGKAGDQLPCPVVFDMQLLMSVIDGSL